MSADNNSRMSAVNNDRKTTTSKCERCYGHGVWLVPPYEFNADLNGYVPGDSFTTCTVCNGAGVVEKKVESKGETESESVQQSSDCTDCTVKD